MKLIGQLTQGRVRSTNDGSEGQRRVGTNVKSGARKNGKFTWGPVHLVTW